MSNATAPFPLPLDTKTLLARLNERLAMLRLWLSHHHGNEPYWWARRITAPKAQQERGVLRQVANLLHIERATARGRIHGTRFATLDEQRAWVHSYENRSCRTAAELMRLPEDATLLALREGKLPL